MSLVSLQQNGILYLLHLGYMIMNSGDN